MEAYTAFLKFCQINLKLGLFFFRSEHKFEIVKRLQARKHIVGMTGDGVNDAPALKIADIGIAVADSTDAARSASDIVLTEPGLSVIISAVLTSRAIFQRMKNYTVISRSKHFYVKTTNLILYLYSNIRIIFSLIRFIVSDICGINHHSYRRKYPGLQHGSLSMLSIK